MMAGGESGNCREHILDRGINFQPFTLFLGHISNPQYYSSTPLAVPRTQHIQTNVQKTGTRQY